MLLAAQSLLISHELTHDDHGHHHGHEESEQCELLSLFAANTNSAVIASELPQTFFVHGQMEFATLDSSQYEANLFPRWRSRAPPLFS